MGGIYEVSPALVGDGVIKRLRRWRHFLSLFAVSWLIAVVSNE